MSKRWFSSGYRAGGFDNVDREAGAVYGVSVTTVGEAKGHGVQLDAEFVDTVVEQGNAHTQGLKARFGHPNMCSTALGTFIGRFKNFRRDGDQARADLFLSNAASETPHGDLKEYVLSMAEQEPDMFGTSIVFTPGREYVRGDDGEKVYDFGSTDALPFIECDKLHACDAVDDPAANEGLFSAFSKETFAGQITEFFDLHPQVFDALSNSPEVIEAIALHGSKIDEFIDRYKAYRHQEKEDTMSDDNPGVEDVAEEALEAAAEETEELEAEGVEPEAVEAEQDEGAESPESSEADADSEQSAEEPEAEEDEAEQHEAETGDSEQASATIDAAEFARVVSEFGAELAADVFSNGGGYEEAKERHYQALAAENEKLRAEVDTLKESASNAGGKAAMSAAEPKPRRSIVKIQS